MTVKCPSCNGTGYIVTDCPYCRNSDSFEFTNLAHIKCNCCNDTGYFEDVCPSCNGLGVIHEDNKSA